MMICTKSSPTWRACIICPACVTFWYILCKHGRTATNFPGHLLSTMCATYKARMLLPPYRTPPHSLRAIYDCSGRYVTMCATYRHVCYYPPPHSIPQYTPLKKWTPPRLWKYVSPKTWFLRNRIAGSTCFLNQNFWVLPVTLGTPFCNWDFQARVTVSEHFQACWHIIWNTVYHILLAFNGFQGQRLHSGKMQQVLLKSIYTLLISQQLAWDCMVP